MNEWLKQPAGTPIEKTKDLFDIDNVFDTILLVTGPEPLYCVALLSRIGKKFLFFLLLLMLLAVS